MPNTPTQPLMRDLTNAIVAAKATGKNKKNYRSLKGSRVELAFHSLIIRERRKVKVTLPALKCMED